MRKFALGGEVKGLAQASDCENQVGPGGRKTFAFRWFPVRVPFESVDEQAAQAKWEDPLNGRLHF